MANNRLYLVCNGCNKRICISKSFGGEWDMRNADAIPEFLREHSNYECYWSDNFITPDKQFEFKSEMEATDEERNRYSI